MPGESILQSTAKSVLTEWAFHAHSACTELVIPDGCIDLIVVRNKDASTWFLTDLSHCSYFAAIPNGDVMFGLRLRPGALVNTVALERWARHHDVADLFEADRFDEFCHVPSSLTESLDGLASGKHTIHEVAKALAVSTRTLQREVGRYTGKSPHFWLSLARIRRACRALPEFDRLADAAVSFGFADQAHMSREVKRWLGASPSSITERSDIFEQLLQPGYG